VVAAEPAQKAAQGLLVAVDEKAECAR